MNRKCFIPPPTHPAVRTSGGQRSLTPSQRHPVPSCCCGLLWPLPCCAAPGLVPAGVFLHSTRTFGVCWPGPQHRGCFSGAIPRGTPLLWELQKDSLVLLAFPILCGPVPSGQRGAPLRSFAVSHLVRHDKPGKISIRQIPDRPAAVPFDILQTSAVNSTAPWPWALPHMPSLLCSGKGCSALLGTS